MNGTFHPGDRVSWRRQSKYRRCREEVVTGAVCVVHDDGGEPWATVVSHSESRSWATGYWCVSLDRLTKLEDASETLTKLTQTKGTL